MKMASRRSLGLSMTIALLLVVAEASQAPKAANETESEYNRKYWLKNKERIKQERDAKIANMTEAERDARRAGFRQAKARTNEMWDQKVANAVEVTPYGTTYDVPTLVAAADRRQKRIDRQKSLRDTNRIKLKAAIEETPYGTTYDVQTLKAHEESCRKERIYRAERRASKKKAGQSSAGGHSAQHTEDQHSHS